MNASLGQRQAVLAGIALLAAVGALAAGRQENTPAQSVAAAPATTWRTATVGVARGRDDPCGQLDDSAAGIVHPVLPCGVKLVVEGVSQTIRTEVVARGPVRLRHEFNLTPALASRLGVEDGARLRWRFAD